MASVEEDVTDFTAFFDRDDVTDDRFKAEYTFVKLARFVEIQGGKPYMRKPSVRHCFSILPSSYEPQTSKCFRHE
jgi:hypothetical protein